MVLPQKQRSAKLKAFANKESLDALEVLLEAATQDGLSPGICAFAERSYDTESEPDQNASKPTFLAIQESSLDCVLCFPTGLTGATSIALARDRNRGGDGRALEMAKEV